VSWRLVNEGVEAQTAIVETKPLPREYVFWPYLMMPDGRLR